MNTVSFKKKTHQPECGSSVRPQGCHRAVLEVASSSPPRTGSILESVQDLLVLSLIRIIISEKSK